MHKRDLADLAAAELDYAASDCLLDKEALVRFDANISFQTSSSKLVQEFRRGTPALFTGISDTPQMASNSATLAATAAASTTFELHRHYVGVHCDRRPRGGEYFGNASVHHDPRASPRALGQSRGSSR